MRSFLKVDCTLDNNGIQRGSINNDPIDKTKKNYIDIYEQMLILSSKLNIKYLSYIRMFYLNR